MFKQLLTPVAGSLPLSFIVAALPVAAVLVLLGVLRRPAWQASLAGLIVGLIIAIARLELPGRPRAATPSPTASCSRSGRSCGSWSTRCCSTTSRSSSSRFDAFRAWVLNHLPNDRRVVLVVIGFCFGALLEGIAGFGTPVAITSSLLILVGFPALEALVFTLIFNTAPVAFGALGVPVTVLGAVTGLPAGDARRHDRPPTAVHRASAAVLRDGALWRDALAQGAVAGAAGRRRLSFALSQFISSNYLDYALTDVLSSLGSLIVTLLFLQVWKPAPDPEFAVERGGEATAARASGRGPAGRAGCRGSS